MDRRWYCVRCQQTVRDSRECPCSCRGSDDSEVDWALQSVLGHSFSQETKDLDLVTKAVEKFLVYTKSLADSNDVTSVDFPMAVDWENLANDANTNFGAGFCEDASSDLAKWAQTNQLRAAAVGGFIGAGYLPIRSRTNPVGYPAKAKGEVHWICVFLLRQKRFAIDLTARQFSPRLSFPMIWEI